MLASFKTSKWVDLCVISGQRYTSGEGGKQEEKMDENIKETTRKCMCQDHMQQRMVCL